jgi:polar amino acid transport system substrate-binding protein
LVFFDGRDLNRSWLLKVLCVLTVTQDAASRTEIPREINTAMKHIAHRLTGPLLGVGLALFSLAQAHAALFAVPENLPPWGIAADRPVNERGIYVDIAEAIKARASVPIEIRFVPYGRMLQVIKSGEMDYAFGVVGPATSEAGKFTVVVAKVPMIAVARKGLPLKALNDLHGFEEVGYLRGGSCGPQVDADAAIKRVAQDSYESAIRKIAAGRLDAWCSAKPGFTYALRSLKMDTDMGESVDYGEVKIAFQVTNGKADSAEAHDLEDLVGKLVAEGAVGQIFNRYVGAPYPP